MRAATAILFAAFLPHLLFAETELPASWPQGWREGYERFERFREQRAKDWPRSDLQIEPDGAVSTGFFLNADLTTHQDLLVFQDGVGCMSSVVSQDGGRSHLQIFEMLMPGRLNAGVVEASGLMGYQHFLPIVWFEVVPEPGAERTLLGGANRKLKILPPPEPAEDYLPNERFLEWCDFQVLPHRSPDDIRDANTKVSPAVFLQVDHGGTVHRKLLEDEGAESALEWRLFFNGRLKVKSPASNETELSAAKFGPGNYTVLAGVTGPDGFLPLSNLLAFTLAPGADGKPTLLFSQNDYGRVENYPKWYREIYPPPGGGGPAVFDSTEALERARALGSAWRGCSEYGNKPDAAWVFDPEEPK